MYKVNLALFMLVLAAIIVRTFRVNRVRSVQGEYNWEAIVRKLRSSLRFFLPLLSVVALALLNFDVLRDVLYSVMSPTTVDSIRQLLTVFFGTHSVLYSLQYVGSFALIGSSVFATAAIAVQIVRNVRYLGVADLKGKTFCIRTAVWHENQDTSVFSFLSLGQLRV